VRGGETALEVGSGERVPGWFALSGFDAIVKRLHDFDEEDLALQVELIRSALRARAPVLWHEQKLPRPASCHGEPSRNPSDWLAHAVEIARTVAGGAVEGSDGSVSWLQPAWSRESMLANRRRELGVIGYDLYDGALGIALFLAAVEREV